MKQLNCWVADDLAEEVETAARQDDRSVSSWLRRLVLRELRSDDERNAPVASETAA